ncbi:hypothetical protein GGH94_001469, partial [Coemansia aciculifera]
MRAAIGIFALFACALASPIMPPIDPNNPLTNPNTNRDLYLVNPAWVNPSGAHMTPEQVATIQNQMIAQRNLEAVAAQLAAQAGVAPPAGIAAINEQPADAQIQAQAQLQAQAQAQAQVQAAALAQT